MLAVSLCALLLFGSVINVYALTDGQKVNVKREYLRILRFAPVYVMDINIRPDDPLERGVDCSRLHYLAYKRAGVLGIQRVTSRDIATGRGGWVGKLTELEDAEDLDLAFFTFKATRPDGHTGTFIFISVNGKLRLLHASSGYGKTVLVPFDNKFKSKLTKIKRITIGDKIDRNKDTARRDFTKESKDLSCGFGCDLLRRIGLLRGN